MTRRLIALLVPLAFFAAACGDDPAPVDAGSGDSTTTLSTTTTAPPEPATPEVQLATARALWAENGPDSYELTTKELCFCPESIWTDTVVDGVVIAHESTSGESPHDPGERTMEALFDEIEAAIAAGYTELQLDFHPETGAVRRYWVDVEELMADEEYGLEVVSLLPHDPTAPVDIEAAALVDDYGCGYGFAKGSADQTLGLSVYSDVGYQPDGFAVDSPVTLPSPDWTAEIRVGRDLFANWCDDVIEPDEPRPQVDEVWTLVAGTLTIDDVEGTEDCSGNPVTGQLTGAVVESPAGEQVELADVDLVNSSWGCFAG